MGFTNQFFIGWIQISWILRLLWTWNQWDFLRPGWNITSHHDDEWLMLAACQLSYLICLRDESSVRMPTKLRACSRWSLFGMMPLRMGSHTCRAGWALRHPSWKGATMAQGSPLRSRRDWENNVKVKHATEGGFHVISWESPHNHFWIEHMQ